MGVERRGRFVEDQDRRRLQERAGNGHALLFAPRQLQPAFADLGLVTLGQGRDEAGNLGAVGRILDLFLRGAEAAIADIIGNGVVEQHGVLGDHADDLAQARLGHRTNILAVDFDRAALDVVEAEQQARDGRLAGARGTDDGYRLAGRDVEGNPLEDGAVGIVGKDDILERDGAVDNGEVAGVGGVEDFLRLVQQLEHGLHVDEARRNFAIQRADEVQRDRQLDHDLVDHHEMADVLGVVQHFPARHQHDGGHAQREDHRLADIQPGQRNIGFDRGLFVLRRGAIVAGPFKRLIAEIFDGFEVEQGIDRLRHRIAVGVVHVLADRDAPVRGDDREPDIDGDRRRDDDDVPEAELEQEDDGVHDELGDRRDADHHAQADNGFDAGLAALDDPRQPAGTALQVKAQAQIMQVNESAVGQATHRVLADAGKQGVTNIVEQLRQQPRRAVGADHQHRHGQDEIERGGRRQTVRHQGIGGPFERKGNEAGQQRARQHGHQGQDHLHLQVRAIGRPQVGHQEGECLGGLGFGFRQRRLSVHQSAFRTRIL